MAVKRLTVGIEEEWLERAEKLIEPMRKSLLKQGMPVPTRLRGTVLQAALAQGIRALEEQLTEDSNE